MICLFKSMSCFSQKWQTWFLSSLWIRLWFFRAVTMRASVRFVSGVDAKVSLQIVTETKTFPTLSTAMWFCIVVNSEVFLGDSSLTPWTLWLSSLMASHMSFGIIFSFFQANLPLHWALSTEDWPVSPLSAPRLLRGWQPSRKGRRQKWKVKEKTYKH